MKKSVLLIAIFMGLLLIPIAHASQITVTGTDDFGFLYANVGQTFTKTLTTTITNADWQTTTTLEGFTINTNGAITYAPQEGAEGGQTVTIRAFNATDDVERTLNFRVFDKYHTGELKISDFRIKDLTESRRGIDALWPGDEIEITIELENVGTIDLEDIYVNLVIDKSELYEDLESSSFDLEGGSYNKITFNINIPANTRSGDYAAEIYVSGVDDDRYRYKTTAFYKFKVVNPRHGLAITEFEFIRSPVTAGTSAALEIDLTNVGTSDEYVEIFVTNAELDITEKIGFDLYEGDSTTKTITIAIPPLTQSGDYRFNIFVEYDDGEEEIRRSVVLGVIRTSSDEEEESQTPEQDVATLILPTSTSIVRAGTEEQFEITISNTGASNMLYTFALEGTENWVSSSDIKPSTLNLAPGTSMPVYLYLRPNADLSDGIYAAKIVVYSGNTEIASKTMNVQVVAISEDATYASFGNRIFGSNGGGIDLTAILVVIIVVSGIGAVVYAIFKPEEPSYKLEFQGPEKKKR